MIKGHNSRRSAITSSELQRKVGSVLKRVAVNKERLVIEREGYPIAALVPYDEFEQLEKERAAKDLRTVLGRMGTDKISEAEVMADVVKAQKRVRVTKRKS